MKEIERIINNILVTINPEKIVNGSNYHFGVISKEILPVIEQYVIKARIDLEKQIEAYKGVCEKYIPTDKLDEANSELILICKETAESMGRDLLK